MRAHRDRPRPHVRPGQPVPVIVDYLNHHPDLGAGARIAGLGAVIGRSRVGARPTLGEYATVRADGENVGVAKFGRDGAALLVRELDRIVGADAVREWLPRAFDAFCHHRPLHVVETRGYPWIEIDFPEDYWRAQSEILPAIEQASQPAGQSTRSPETAVASRGVLHHV